MKQLDLFKHNEDGAIFSDCRKYRYVLWRNWDESKPSLMFIGLNPSTANESKNDPTIRRVIQFANDWGYGSVYMLNLFAWVSAYPADLKTCKDPLGDNDKWLSDIGTKCNQVIFAWGSFKEAKKRSKEVIKLFTDGQCLVQNNDGSPKHPLYVAGNTKPVKFIGEYGVCKICGCTDNNACYHPGHGNCFWVDDDHDICSHCWITEWKNDPETIHKILG